LERCASAVAGDQPNATQVEEPEADVERFDSALYSAFRDCGEMGIAEAARTHSNLVGCFTADRALLNAWFRRRSVFSTYQ
jgi:hypothetical protein